MMVQWLVVEARWLILLMDSFVLVLTIIVVYPYPYTSYVASSRIKVEVTVCHFKVSS